MTRPTPIVFACCVVLWVCTSQISHYLAPWHISVFVGGLLISFAALRLSFSAGWPVSLLIGLLMDGQAPVPFGFHGILLVMAHVGIFQLRSRFPREETIVAVSVALLANAALFVAISIALLRWSPAPLSMSGRLFFDFLASELLIVVAAPWFFALQERSLELAGVSLRSEQRGLAL